jgi:hypothetical protein
METNCHHTRDGKGVKLTGGMLHAKSHDEAAERAQIGLTVQVKSGGRAYFADKTGREVSLYLSVHPEHTAKGKAALAAYWVEENKRRETERQKAEDLDQALQDAIDEAGGPEAALAKLKGEG